jgi:hypothetical protein
MASTSLIALATMLLTGSAGANDAAPHVATVAQARAAIVAGVRTGPSIRDAKTRTQQPLVNKPRERPCPETTDAPCRLIVTDMP